MHAPSVSLSETRLRNLLAQVPGVEEIIVVREESKLIGAVVSSGFATMEEHKRQELVWGLILDQFSDAEQAEVGFVFTNTPEERARAQSEAV